MVHSAWKLVHLLFRIWWFFKSEGFQCVVEGWGMTSSKLKNDLIRLKIHAVTNGDYKIVPSLTRQRGEGELSSFCLYCHHFVIILSSLSSFCHHFVTFLLALLSLCYHFCYTSSNVIQNIFQRHPKRPPPFKTSPKTSPKPQSKMWLCSHLCIANLLCSHLYIVILYSQLYTVICL